MAAKKGHPKYGGRAPGTPNKITLSIKDAIEKAFQDVGGADYLLAVADKDPKTFCALVGKLLPKDIKIEGNLSLGALLDSLLAKTQQPPPTPPVAS